MALRLFAPRTEHFQRLSGWARLSWRSYRGGPAAEKLGGAYAVDLRSDVLTKPTTAMKEAMMEATMGDDVFGEDVTINKLQSTVAEMFNKEAALFVPSGTMGNLISVLSHCHSRGLEVLLGHQSHLIIYEQGGMATVGGVHPRTIPNLSDGTFDLEVVKDYIRPLDDSHQPFTGLICVENTHNVCGGTVLPLDFLAELRKIADDHKLPVHMDGARMMNSAAALDVAPSVILENVDSVSMCFSKGLGAPVGSIISGSAEFIARAVRLRKVLGGGMRQPGMLAAAALFTLDGLIPRLQTDHRHARMIAEAVMKESSGLVHVDLERVQTNIVMIEMLKEGLDAQQFCDRLSQVTMEEEKEIGEPIVVLSYPSTKRVTRLVAHSSVDTKDILAAIAKITYVLHELANQEAESKASHG
ncbi:hypothetical protein NP493_410g00003 [Ridgeia piscesae]|uniref:Aromatic amino acid beta-eliminating lyase/threonine aldolase domain-containing protein n=1 Tax=Ridgeia piscesae TaxID=27915 RepID=A0AAD9NSG0_RIDPI|nr:hypothetical protein NP493_410g00003 [Ridgeia piscesae]